MAAAQSRSARRQNLRILVECGIMIAAAFVLNLVHIYQLPYGGAVTLFSMAPIMLISLRHGVKWGMGCGFVYSCIKLLLGLGDVAYMPTPITVIGCILLDYTVAFTVIGLAGMFRNGRLLPDAGKNRFLTTTLGVTVSVVLRFLCHLVSGAVLWYELTKGWTEDASHIVFQYGMWMYSFLYNGSYMLPELILSVIAVPVLLNIMEKLGVNSSIGYHD